MFEDDDYEDDSFSENSESPDEDIVSKQQPSSKKRKLIDDSSEGKLIEENGEKAKEEVSNSKNVKKLKRKAKKLKNGTSILSGNDFKELTEIESSYSSHIFKIQAEELLIPEVCASKEKREVFLPWFEKFKKIVAKITNSKHEPCLVKDYLNVISSDEVCLPLPKSIFPTETTKGSFKIIPPSSIFEIGSWGTKTNASSEVPFDVALQIPDEYFIKSDKINHIYHLKRAIYISYIAQKLRSKSKIVQDVKFCCPDGDLLRPLLQITLPGEINVKVNVYIAPEAIKGDFGPSKNHIRTDYFFGQPREDVQDVGASTPHYNTTIQSDLLLRENNDLLLEEFKNMTCTVIKSIKLLKLWLENRSLNHGFGGFSNFMMMNYVLCLLKAKKVNNLWSTYNITRAVFTHLATEKSWIEASGISLAENKISDEFREAFDVVFLDFSGKLNIAPNMSKFTLKRVMHEAKIAAQILDDFSLTNFNSLFTTPVPFEANFDHILKFRITPAINESIKEDDKFRDIFLDSSGLIPHTALRIILPIIQKCVGARATLLHHELPNFPPWALSNPQDNFSTQGLKFGLILNREKAFKLIEKCPSDSGEDSQNFKAFWGEDKTSLKRFLDGTILESVSFLNNGRVLYQMIKHILHHHLKIKIKSESYLDNQVGRMVSIEYNKAKPTLKKKFKKGSKAKKVRKMKKIKLKGKKEEKDEEALRIETVCNLAYKSFDKLSKILRKLELPLVITSVQGSSPILRYTHVAPSPPCHFLMSKNLVEKTGTSLKIKNEEESGLIDKILKYVEPIGVVIQLEGSGKWPDDVKAIERLKAAFLIKIGELMGEESGIVTQVHPNYLLVSLDGFIFKIRLTYFRELILLKQLRGEDGIIRTKDTPQSYELEKNALLLPQLTSTLHGLWRQYSSFGEICRVVKRFFSAHFLLSPPHSRHETRWSEESTELLVASLFLHPTPYSSPPNDVQAGFIRFLILLGSTDFSTVPIILNFSSKMSREEVEGLEKNFSKNRSVLPLIYIATPEDRNSAWTKNLGQVFVQRAILLAREALSKISPFFSSARKEKGTFINRLQVLFRGSLDVFDALIYLKKSMIGRKVQELNVCRILKVKYIEFEEKKSEVIPVTGFDPIELYLEELVTTFGHICTFVNDVYGGGVIGVVWKPNALDTKGFSISGISGRKLDEKWNLITTDPVAILEEIEFMGEGLVDFIKIKEETNGIVENNDNE